MKFKLLFIAAFPIFIISACVPEKTIDPNGPNGFGASTKPLSGTPWVLPAGINLESGEQTSPTSYNYVSRPADGTLPFYLTFRNNNNQLATVVFPVGLMFPAPDTFTQNSIIIQPDSIVISAQSSYYLKMNTFCINDHRTFSYSATYGTPLVSDNASLTQLLQIIATKKLVTDDPNEILQKAIWSVADSGKLTPADITAINLFQ
jgi:hypothetical protein